VAHGEYQTEVFSTVRQKQPAEVVSAADEGAAVVDEWEQALRGDSGHTGHAVVRPGPPHHVEPARHDEVRHEDTGHQDDGPAEHEHYEPGPDAHEQTATQVFPQITDDEPVEPHTERADLIDDEDTKDTAEERPEPSVHRDDAEHEVPGQAEPQLVEERHDEHGPAAEHDEAAGSYFPSDEEDPAEQPQGHGVCSALFGDYPGADERVDTAIIARIADEEAHPEQAWDEHPEGAGETTELIPAYRDQVYEDDQRGDDRVVQGKADAGADRARTYLDPLESSGPPEVPGERTELIAAYRDAPESLADPAADPAEPARDAARTTRAKGQWHRRKGLVTMTEDGRGDSGAGVGIAEGASAGAGVAVEVASPATERRRRPWVLVALLLLAALLGAIGAYYFAGKATDASLAYPTNNDALIDKAATAQVISDVTKAIQAVYSYDSSQLDADENRALSFITGSYVDQFKQNFAQVRQLGPQAKLSLQSTVAAIGVQTLSDDNATLLVMLNQVGRRGNNPQPLTANIRLSVTAEKLDGQWKVSEVAAR
jgi:hypothetical protein